MDENRRGILKSSAGVAVSTMICRVLGLVRSMLEAKFLGGGYLASAWGLAFTLPNQFRSILGEGALSAALMPIMATSEQQDGEEEMRRKFGIVFVFLGILLAILTIIFSAGAIIISHFVSGYWLLAMQIVPAVMPYAVFMCLVGVAGTLLNLRKIFFIPSLGNMLLNVFIIGTFFCLNSVILEDREMLYILSWSVLASGATHLLLQLFLLWRAGVFPVFKGRFKGGRKILKELFMLGLPGMIGAAATQFSFAVDQLLAGIISEYALPALRYSERLIYLPIGVFAISLGSVLFSTLSRIAAKGKLDELKDHVAWGLRMVAFICIPMAVFLVIMRVEVLRLIFLRGEFDQKCLQETAFATLFYAAGIPFFCAVKVILPAFYSRKDTKTPLKCSLTAIGCNVILNLILMWPLQQGGIALATVLTSLLNNILLIWMLNRQSFSVPFGKVAVSIIRCGSAALLAVAPVWFFYRQWNAGISWLPADLLPLTAAVAVFTVIYFLLCRLFGAAEGGELLSIFKKQ